MLTGEGGSSDSLGSESGALSQGRVQGEELLGVAGRWMEAKEGSAEGRSVPVG